MLPFVGMREDRQCGEFGFCSIRAERWSRLFTFLFALALLIHFILLSTDRFNWLDGPRARPSSRAERSVDHAGTAGLISDAPATQPAAGVATTRSPACPPPVRR